MKIFKPVYFSPDSSFEESFETNQMQSPNPLLPIDEKSSGGIIDLTQPEYSKDVIDLTKETIDLTRSMDMVQSASKPEDLNPVRLPRKRKNSSESTNSTKKFRLELDMDKFENQNNDEFNTAFIQPTPNVTVKDILIQNVNTKIECYSTDELISICKKYGISKIGRQEMIKVLKQIQSYKHLTNTRNQLLPQKRLTRKYLNMRILTKAALSNSGGEIPNSYSDSFAPSASLCDVITSTTSTPLRPVSKEVNLLDEMRQKRIAYFAKK